MFPKAADWGASHQTLTFPLQSLGTSEPKGPPTALTVLPQILTALGMGSSSFPGLQLTLPPASLDGHSPAAPNLCFPELATLISTKGSLRWPFPVGRACLSPRSPGVAMTASFSLSEPFLIEK